MAKIKWLGGPGEPETNDCMGVSFKKGEFVDTDNGALIALAKKNRFYEVEGEDAAVKARKETARAVDKAKAKR